LIPERTKAGIKAAKARGKLPGNPGLRELRPDALAKASRARRRSHLADLTTNMSSWLPIVQRMRPDHPEKT
jgi:DNA invertase Pin-like site-specific DNA recombinase